MPYPFDNERFIKMANFDSCYAVWLRKVNELCERFLNVELGDIEDAWDPRDYYDNDMRPATYFKDVLVPAFEVDQGCDFIEELVAENAMWGGEKP
jgi:hypothetical protein